MNYLAKEMKREGMQSLIVTEYHHPSVFDTLARQWNHLIAPSPTNTPFLTWQWQKIWWKHASQGLHLKVITISEENGRLCGIAPLYVEDKNGVQKLMLLGSTDLCDYRDFIVKRGEEKSFYHTLLSHLSSTATTQTILYLNSLQQHSPTLFFLKEMAMRKGYALDSNLEDTAPSLNLPLSFESYLKGLSKKNRHEIRRKIRKAERNAKIAYLRIHDPTQIMHTIPLFLNLFRKSAGEKHTFLNSQRERFFLTIAQELSQLRWLELSALSFDEREVAYLLCFNYQNTLYLYNSAYDPIYSNFSPGIVAITYCLEDAIKRGIKRFDFLRGGEIYKYHFGGQDHNLYTLTLRFTGETKAWTE